MKDDQKVDLGSVQIHNHVIADIAANALSEVKGLRLADDDVWGKVQEFVGLKKYPAITVYKDKNNQVIVEVRVIVQYGLNVSDVAGEAQDLIREAIDRTGDIDVKDVNINIRGIERGDR